MPSYLDLVQGEVATINHMLVTLPFDRSEGHAQTKAPYFLDVYRVHRPEMQLLNEDTGRFPLDASKLLKLGILLGNLLKSRQQDEEASAAQQRQQHQFSRAVGGPLEDPFRERAAEAPAAAPAAAPPPPPPNVASVAQPAAHQARFMLNLVQILKNYDVGEAPRASVASSSSTLSQAQASPIKLLSKQLLIEKLEINIDLDNLFTYKIVLKLLATIYEILAQQLIEFDNGTAALTREAVPGAAGGGRDASLSLSIFLTASCGLADSGSMTLDEYLGTLRQVLARVSQGVIEPFVLVIVTSVAEKGVIDRFGELLKSLD
jgi:hypothetical protein